MIVRETEDDVEANDLMKWVVTSLNVSGVRNALKSMSTRIGVRIRHEQLNPFGLKFPVENGVIEPKEFGQCYEDVAPSTPTTPSSSSLDCRTLKYDSHASTYEWDRALEELVP